MKPQSIAATSAKVSGSPDGERDLSEAFHFLLLNVSENLRRRALAKVKARQ